VSPDERDQAIQETLQQYQEQMACLSLMDKRIKELVRPLKNLESHMENGGNWYSHLSYEKFINELGNIGGLLADYRETYQRCQELHTVLNDAGLGAIITPVSLPARALSN